MTNSKRFGFGFLAVGGLAIAAYLFLTLGNPPEDAHKIADNAFKNYCEGNGVPIKLYSSRQRSGIGLGYYYFDYELSPDYALSGGYEIYRVTVWGKGLAETEVKGLPFTVERF